MNRSSSRFIFVLGLSAGLAACAGMTDDADETASGLEIQSADPAAGLRATLLVDGEEIAVTVTDRDGVRDTSVTGADGTSYAVWHTRLADLDTTGSYGDRTFGRVEDADSDGDSAAWADLAASRVGHVLRAVSSAAAEAADGAPAGTSERLTTVGQIHSSLAMLARDPEEAAYNGCWFGYGYYDEWAYCSDTGIIVGAQTARPSSSCTRDYYVSIHRDSDWLWICGDGTADGEWGRAVCARTPGFGGFRSYSSKHWDSLNAGAPIWLRRGVTCQ